jgi:hypothetical protein
MDGDIMPDPVSTTLVEGEVDKDTFLVAILSGAIGIRNNLRRVSFNLLEV